MATRSWDERVTALEETVAGLQNLPNELALFRSEVSARFDRLEARITQESEQLYARMRMLHEELIDRIRIGREGPGGVGSGAPSQRRRRPKR